MPSNYSKFRYFYPPRTENKIFISSAKSLENTWIAQGKMDGSCIEIYINEDVKVYNRHKTFFTKFKIEKSEILNLNKYNNWMVLCGEYMDKAKKHQDGKLCNNKFVIWDIIVYNNQYLVDTTFEERIKLLDELFGVKDFDEYLYKISENVYRVKSFDSDFEKIFNKITKIDMFEGLVLKKKNGKLERGIREKNNTTIQCKVRRANANYQI